MKNTVKQRGGFLIAAAVAALLGIICAVCVSVFGPENKLQLFSAPFELLGKGLRALSLSGSAGNAAAIVLYALICAIPALFALVLFCRGKRVTASGLLLILLSGYTYAVMYFFINPNLVRFSIDLPQKAREQFFSVLSVGMAFAFYGLLLLSAAVSLAAKGKREEAAFYRAVKLLCAFAGCVLSVAFFGFELIDCIAAFQTGGADAAVGMITFLLHGMLYGLLFAAAYCVYGGADLLKTNLYSPENAALLRKVSHLLLADFLGSIAVCVLLNVINFALTSVLKNISFEFNVSVSVAAIAAVCLFACNLLLRAIRLYEENRLTI